MENNEILMCMDVKLDIHDKRPDSIQFKSWTKCQVKIEAIKCLPCFLRITIQKYAEDIGNDAYNQKSLSVSINVPGVTISLAASRTKQFSYGLFWTHNRRACFIYFALETETSCRRHMKWIKKSIKNLELHRQIFLEQRRNSRGPARLAVKGVATDNSKENECSSNRIQLTKKDANAIKTTLGPLPKIPDGFDNNCSSWSRRVSRASEIYEEIFEGLQASDSSRLSRRFSRSSIASGIYEEMKPTASNFNAILEEALEFKPPLPPLPPPRKRINTFETDAQAVIGEFVRSNTNPEFDLAKKKKYKIMLDNIFGGVRSKRADSVSEHQVSTVEDLIVCNTPKQANNDTAAITTTATTALPIYTNEAVGVKRMRKLSKPNVDLTDSKRNSFSSPDLSKINFLDTFDEDKVAEILLNSFANSDSLELSSASLDVSAIIPNEKRKVKLAHIFSQPLKADSLESINVSQELPSNFNFSACNSSKINLIGANGAVRLPNLKKNKILLDDLTGYCVMAPILKKVSSNLLENVFTQPLISAESTSSGYCSSTSSCTTSTEDQFNPLIPKAQENKIEQLQKLTTEESVIYENMHGSLHSTTSNMVSLMDSPTLSSLTADFTGNLYENLLTVKAAQELEQPTCGLSTSTPTDSPLTQNTPQITPVTVEEENYYQTPRKSIISIDDKIPSYYPNSCDTLKTRRQSPFKDTPNSSSSEKSSNAIGLRHLVNIKMQRERKENLYISSPQKIIEQRQSATSTSTTPPTTIPPNKANKTQKNKKTGAHKLSDNVYTVKHARKKSSSNEEANGLTNEMQEKLQTELIQLAMLQNIDFKFDDGLQHDIQTTPTTTLRVKQQQEEKLENFYQVVSPVADYLEQYAPAKTTPQRQPTQHHLQLNQESNTKSNATHKHSVVTAVAMTQSKVESHSSDLQLSNIRKFASLPRFKKIDLSPLKLKINNVLQRNQHQEF